MLKSILNSYVYIAYLWCSGHGHLLVNIISPLFITWLNFGKPNIATTVELRGSITESRNHSGIIHDSLWEFNLKQ